MKISHLAAIAAVVLLSSCSTTKDNTLAYFRNIENSKSGEMPSTPADYAVRIQPDDELVITVTSTVPAATAIYNLPLSNPARLSELTYTSQPKQQTYVVDSAGNITFPVLGTIAVQGKTTREVEDMLTREIAKDVVNPIVRCELISFNVVVMGEVRNPHRVNAHKQRYTLLDALADCGDLTEYAQRTNVLVVREENGKNVYHHLDLTDTSIFASPYFYMQQNDVVYVTPNTIRVDNSRYNQNNAYKLTVISTIVSATSIIASLVIALTVK